MTLHLHIGAHKTATTHLQATLIRHRAQLAEAGVQFERPDDIRALIGDGRRAAAKMGALPSIRRARAERRLGKVDAGAKRLLISDENNLGLCAEIFDQNLLYPTARRRLMVWRRLAQQRETIIYFGIRNYAEFLSGAYVQSIRQSALYTPDAQSLSALTRLPRRWTDVLADVRRALPGARIRCWPFEDYPRLAPRLLAEMTGETLTPVKRRPMATPSQSAVEAYQAARRPKDATLHQIAVERPITPHNPRFSLWSSAQHAALTEMYESDLAALRADLGEEFLRP